MSTVSTMIHYAKTAKKLFTPGAQMPVYLLQFVTTKCDAKCGHCFYWQSLNQKVRHELTLEEFEALAKSLGAMMQVTLTGGSPELRKDLAEIAHIYYKHCNPINMTLCMNGYHTDRIEKHVRKILETCPKMKLTVGISLDGIGEEHDRLRGMPGLFNNVTKTFSRLSELKKQFSNLRLACAVCVSGLNVQSAETTAGWAKENLDIDLLKPIIIRGNPKDEEALRYEYNMAYHNLIVQDHSNLTSPIHTNRSFFAAVVSAKEQVQRDIIQTIHATGKSPVVCSAARETAVVYPHGEVAGCELRSERLGNLRDVDMDFRKLWFNHQANAFRDTVKKEKCSCCHHCFLSPPVFRSPVLWPKLAKSILNLVA